MMFDMRRRQFITLLGGAAAAWPVIARGQQPNRMRRIGMLMGQAANDPEGQTRIIAFVQGLAQLGWTSAKTCGSNSLGCRQCRRHSQIRRGNSRARAGYHPRRWRVDRRAIAPGDPLRAGRVHDSR